MRYINIIKSILAFSIILFNVDLAFAESQISQKEIKLVKNITSLIIKDTVLGNDKPKKASL